jgi:hypothetical protein
MMLDLMLLLLRALSAASSLASCWKEANRGLNSPRVELEPEIELDDELASSKSGNASSPSIFRQNSNGRDSGLR